MITSKQVTDFKESFCNENKIIPDILKNNFKDLLTFPLLDVGSGLGDISSSAFNEKEVIHLDVGDYSSYKLPAQHTRVIGDFFTYQPETPIGTLLLSHVLQFIDADINQLRDRINDIHPEYILVVQNTNNDFMGQLLQWFDAEKIPSNPEKIIDFLPSNYIESKKVSFVADLTCPDYATLSQQISYLWDTTLLNEQISLLEKFLKLHLPSPSFQINQEIVLYRMAH